MMTVTLREQTARQLAKLADEQATSPDELAEKAIRALLRAETSRILTQESEAFRVMHADLLEKFVGEYVAVRKGAVVDHDADLQSIYLRIDGQYPDETILIKQVQPEVERVFTVRSPRIVRE